MAKKLKPIEQVAKILGGRIDAFTDGSQSWIQIKGKGVSIDICFDGKGQKFEEFVVAKDVMEVVRQEVVARIKNTNSHE